jgi:hypothetical protein
MSREGLSWLAYIALREELIAATCALQGGEAGVAQREQPIRPARSRRTAPGFGAAAASEGGEESGDSRGRDSPGWLDRILGC